MKQLPMTGPLHNSIAPFVKLRDAGVRTYLGVDNVHDLFMPMVDGDIWTECRMLMEAARFYDIDAVAEWACAQPITAKAGEKAAAKSKATSARKVETAVSDGTPPAKTRAAGGRRSR